MEKIRHIFQDFVIIDNRIWFSSSVMNGIFCADAAGGHAELVAVFPGEHLFQNRLYTEVYAYGDELIFIPYMAEKISLYNKIENKFVQLEAPLSKAQRRGRSFVSAQWENKIVLFHDYMLEFSILNTEDYSIQRYPLAITKQLSRFAHINSIIDNCAYVVVSNLMITVQLDNARVTIQEIVPNEVLLAGMKYDGQIFWLIDRSNQLYTYQLGEKRAKKVLKLLSIQENQVFFRIRDIITTNFGILFFVNELNYFIQISKPSMEKEIISYEEPQVEGAHVEYAYIDEKRHQVWILLSGEDIHRILDIDTGIWGKISYDTAMKEIIDKYKGHTGQTLDISHEMMLGKGLERLKLCLALQNAASPSDFRRNCGKEIYQRII